MATPRSPVFARILILVLQASIVTAPPRAEEKAPPMTGMKRYQLVLLRRAANPKYVDEREIQATQEAYLAWLKRLHAAGTVLASGPVEKGGDLDTVLVLATRPREEAEAIVRENPWVIAGRLAPEIHPWWAATDAFRPASDVTRLTACWIGFLKRPPNAPQLPAEKLEEIQKGHLENIRKMAASKDLAVAGPLDEDVALRGIFIFRTDDPERIKKLVAEDPAVKMGRLAVELYRWAVPEGAVP